MPRILALAALALVLFMGLNALEMWRNGEVFDPVTLAFEFADTALLVAAVTITAWMALEVRDLGRERTTLLDNLSRARIEGDQWRETAQVYLNGLGEAMRAQFATWRLTGSEAEIAMLLLKGLSHKEIAGLRATSEATVRQQARAIYLKSGLASRSELAAYFLDDLTAAPSESPAPGAVLPPAGASKH